MNSDDIGFKRYTFINKCMFNHITTNKFDTLGSRDLPKHKYVILKSTNNAM